MKNSGANGEIKTKIGKKTRNIKEKAEKDSGMKKIEHLFYHCGIKQVHFIVYSQV